MILSVCTVLMLLHVLPIWRRVAIVTALDDDYADTDDDTDVDAIEIEAYVRDGQAYLDPHLKIDDVVEHCRRDARQLCRA